MTIEAWCIKSARFGLMVDYVNKDRELLKEIAEGEHGPTWPELEAKGFTIVPVEIRQKQS
jgi:hypothetical protein